MIGKAPATGSGFRGIVNYLVMGKLGQEKDRVAWSETRNLIVDEPEFVPRIMRSTASRSTRCVEPVYHFAICWHKSEVPSRDIQAAIADATLEDLDLTEHQSLLIAHKDTEHHHLHIVVNRVHPETAKAWDRWKDWVRIEKSLGRQAKAHGLIYVPGRHNEPEQFRATPKKARNSEFRRAERLGTKDALRPRWTKEQIAEKRAVLVPTFEQVKSWAELERALEHDGLNLERKGQGIVIGDATGTMKLSDLKKEIRLGFMEQRFSESWNAYEKRRDELVPVPEKLPTSADDDTAAPPTSKATAPEPREHAAMPALGKRRQPDSAEEAAATNQAPPILPGDGGGAPAGPRRDTATTPEKAAPPKVDQRPRMDRAEFLARWEKRSAEREAKRADDERKKAAEAKAKEDAEFERRRREEYEETLRLLKEKFAAPSKIEDSPKLPPLPILRAKNEVVPPQEPSPDVKARDAARTAKTKADAEADLAFKLHNAGLVTRKQLAHSVRDRKNAQEEVDKHVGGRAKLAKELRTALAPTKPVKEIKDPRGNGPKSKDKFDKSR